MTKLINLLYEHVGFELGFDDHHLLIYAQSVALSRACEKLATPHCIENTVDLYSAGMEDPSNNKLG